MGVLDAIANATVARGTVILCMDASIHEEYDRLVAQLNEVAPRDNMGRTKTRPIVEAMEANREKAAESEVEFTFQALPWIDRMDLEAAHPARKGDEKDQERGFNRITLIPALIRASCAKAKQLSTGDETSDIPDKHWDHLLGYINDKGEKIPGVLNRQQIIDLWNTAAGVNDLSPSVPMSALALLNLPATDESLKPPAPGESAPADGKAGSRPTSRKSSATKKAASRATSRKSPSPNGTSTPAT
jgi:hypothetical protein